MLRLKFRLKMCEINLKNYFDALKFVHVKIIV